MIELKRLKLINWHNFENVTFDCARLTYMIGVNAVGKTTILDAIRYCLTTNRNFNALGNKKSGRTLQGSVHAKQRGENAYRRPGHTVAYIGAEFYDSLKRAPFVIAVRVESEGPMQELHPGDQTWYLSEDGCTLEQLPFIDPRTGAPSAKEDFKPAVGRLSYTRSPSEARDRICRALGIGRASSPLGKKFNEVFQMGTSMDEIPNFREFLYQYILPQPELDLEALQGDRLELENLHAVLAEAQTRADALEEIVNDGREAAGKQTEALVNRGAALLARAAADGGEQDVWQGHLDAGHRQLEALNARYAEAKNAEAEARRAYLAAHSAAGASGEGRALDAMEEELSRRKTAQDAAARKAAQAEGAASKAEALLTALRRSGFASGWKLENLTADTLPQLTDWLAAQEKPLEEAYFAARQNTAALRKEQADKRAELDAVSGGKWVYPHGDAATRVRDAVNAELKSRGMQPDAKIFCELLAVADESWQDCVEACLGDRRFDILVPPAHYEAAKSAFVALKDKVGPISLLDTPGIRKANRHAETAPADSLAAQVTSENPLAAQYADTILRRIVCCDTPETLEQYPDSATRDLLRHHPFRLERLRTPQRYIGLEARRARAGALAEELEALAERTRTAAQTEQNLKTAYDQYQNFQRGTAPQQLAGLWEARTAAEKARNAVAEQEGKLAEYREKIDRTLELGGDQLLLQGGLHPQLRIDFYERLFSDLKALYPTLRLHALGAPEVAHIARISGLTTLETLRRLMAAGLDSLPGAGAEILDPVVRRAISPAKPSVEKWLDVMHEAHCLGLPTSATMMYGHVETPHQRVDHLLRIRDLQARCPEGKYGFIAFIPWIFRSTDTELERQGVTTRFSPLEYLRIIAVSRLVLCNIRNIQASWLTVGKATAQAALHSGANDMGSIMIEENVVSSAGAHNRFDAEGIRGAIREAGFTPRLRDQLYGMREYAPQA